MYDNCISSFLLKNVYLTDQDDQDAELRSAIREGSNTQGSWKLLGNACAGDPLSLVKVVALLLWCASYRDPYCTSTLAPSPWMWLAESHNTPRHSWSSAGLLDPPHRKQTGTGWKSCNSKTHSRWKRFMQRNSSNLMAIKMENSTFE